MGAVQAGGEFVITRGDGAYVWDADGRRYVDATAGLWFTNVGHGTFNGRMFSGDDRLFRSVDVRHG